MTTKSSSSWGQLSHLAAHRPEVLNSDGGAARTSVWPQVTPAAVLYKPLDWLLFSFIHLTLISGDHLLIQLALSNCSLQDLSRCWFLLFLVVILTFPW